MSRSFLTGLNLNKNELLNARIQNLATAPSNPVAGQIYFDTDTSQITLWDGTAWVSLAAGGDVGSQVQAAIDLLTTDDIEEGTTNKYFATSLVDSHLSGGDGIVYSTGSIEVDLVTGGGLGITSGQLGVDRTTVDAWYDASGAASTVAGDLTTHISDTSTHGVTGAIVGTTDTQTLSSKSISGSLTFLDGSSANSGVIYGQNGDLVANTAGNIQIVSVSSDIVLSADGDVYKGSIATGNQIITQNNLDTYIGDATVTGATGDTITDRITTAAAGALSDAQAYADALVQGLNVKDSVRVASATDIDILNATEIDGVTLASGDRVLLFGQSTATENGIYVFTTSLARAADADPVADELGKGSYVLVTNGTYASTGWLVTAYSAGATTWTQFSAANEYTAGNGIAIASNAISVDLDSDSLAVSGSGLKVNFNAQGGLDNDSGVFINTGTGLTVNGSNQLTFASGYGVKKYAVNNTLLEPTSNVVSWVVNHAIGTRDVTVQVFENSTYTQVEVDVARTDTANVTLSWVATANVAADTYRVVVVG